MAGARDRMRAGFRGRVRALRSRNFRLFFTGQLISNSGNWLTLVALTLLVLHLTNSGVAVGLVAACQFGPILILSAFAGLIADRSIRPVIGETEVLGQLRAAAATTTRPACQAASAA